MSSITHKAAQLHQGIFNKIRCFDGLAPLLFRLYLAPIMISAGLHKFHNFDDMVSWFGNADWGLGLPFPELMVFLAAGTELVGGILLLVGLAVRWISIPLIFTMIVAISSVHWENGWFAIAPGNPETSTAKVLADVGIPAAKASLVNSEEVGRRVVAAKGILKTHGNYNWLTEKGNFVILNNGIEFAATYFIMLLSLIFTGAGRFFSLDYWLGRKFLPHI